jgi:hypothetical protein
MVAYGPTRAEWHLLANVPRATAQALRSTLVPNMTQEYGISDAYYG